MQGIKHTLPLSHACSHQVYMDGQLLLLQLLQPLQQKAVVGGFPRVGEARRRPLEALLLLQFLESRCPFNATAKTLY